MFEFYLDYDKQILDDNEIKIYLRWLKWADKLLETPTEIKDKMQPNEMIVSTVDLIRYTKLIQTYIDMMCHVLVCGPTGTGKTIYIKMIMAKLSKDLYQTIEIGFSA